MHLFLRASEVRLVASKHAAKATRPKANYSEATDYLLNQMSQDSIKSIAKKAYSSPPILILESGCYVGLQEQKFEMRQERIEIPSTAWRWPCKGRGPGKGDR